MMDESELINKLISWRRGGTCQIEELKLFSFEAVNWFRLKNTIKGAVVVANNLLKEDDYPEINVEFMDEEYGIILKSDGLSDTKYGNTPRVGHVGQKGLL